MYPTCLSAMPSVGTVELQKLNRRDPAAKRLGRIGWDGRGKHGKEGREQKAERAMNDTHKQTSSL